VTPSGRVVVVVGVLVVVVDPMVVVGLAVVDVVVIVVVVDVGPVVPDNDEPLFPDVIEHAATRRTTEANTTRRIVMEVASAWALIFGSLDRRRWS
jgi:hypothetical protein